METPNTERTLSELDHVRLTRLVRQHPRVGAPSAVTPLEQVLDEADIVPWRQLSPDVVSMHSRVLLKDLPSGEQNPVALCYPADADAGAGFLSVLSPAGCSLLGRRVGHVVSWPTPAGGQRSARILGILFQPESSGNVAL